MDRTTKVMVNRSWKPFVDKSTGKWLTGDSFYINSRCDPLVEDHEVRILDITPAGTEHGRSSAKIVFEDRDKYGYEMLLPEAVELIKDYLKGRVGGDAEFIHAKFKQVKKGSSLFIEVVKDNEK